MQNGKHIGQLASSTRVDPVLAAVLFPSRPIRVEVKDSLALAAQKCDLCEGKALGCPSSFCEARLGKG